MVPCERSFFSLALAPLAPRPPPYQAADTHTLDTRDSRRLPPAPAGAHGAFGPRSFACSLASSIYRAGGTRTARTSSSGSVWRLPLFASVPVACVCGCAHDAMTLSTGGFSPCLAVSKVYDGTWVDDRRCGKGTVGAVAYSNGEVEVCSFQASASHHTAVAALTSEGGCRGCRV